MVVTYATRVMAYEVSGSRHLLRLLYSPEQNRHLDGYDICWGMSTIKFDTGRRACEATWACNPPDKKFDGTVKGTLTTATREEVLERETIMRIRRRQYEFKQALRGYSAVCELTGETEWRALDAAHIVEVRGFGSHSPDNGLLLRTDLHRLFDAGVLRISSKDGKVSLAKSIKGGSGYRALVKGPNGLKLQPETLERVRANLRERELSQRLSMD